MFEQSTPADDIGAEQTLETQRTELIKLLESEDSL